MEIDPAETRVLPSGNFAAEAGRVLIDRFRPVGGLGGIDYCRLSDRFGIPRPDPVAALARLGRRSADAGNSLATGSDSQGSREDMP